MRQYKHLLILQPETAPPDVWKQITKGIEQLQADGYCMSDYHELQTFTVLVFEKNDVLGVPMPKITDYGPPTGFGAR